VGYFLRRVEGEEREREESDAPTAKRTSVDPTQHPTVMPSVHARTWFRRYISTNSALDSCAGGRVGAGCQRALGRRRRRRGERERDARGPPSRRA